jgi:hypothetical protein
MLTVRVPRRFLRKGYCNFCAQAPHQPPLTANLKRKNISHCHEQDVSHFISNSAWKSIQRNFRFRIAHEFSTWRGWRVGGANFILRVKTHLQLWIGSKSQTQISIVLVIVVVCWFVNTLEGQSVEVEWCADKGEKNWTPSLSFSSSYFFLRQVCQLHPYHAPSNSLLTNPSSTTQQLLHRSRHVTVALRLRRFATLCWSNLPHQI